MGAKLIVCRICDSPVGECEHTEGELPHGFELKIAGLGLPVYVDKMDVLFELGEVKPEPMGRPSGGILFREFNYEFQNFERE